MEDRAKFVLIGLFTFAVIAGAFGFVYWLHASAGEFDALILTLQQTLGISVLMVTHDLDSLHRVCDRIAVLGDGKIIAAGTMDKMLESKHPWLLSYFHGDRAHADWHVRVKG